MRRSSLLPLAVLWMMLPVSIPSEQTEPTFRGGTELIEVYATVLDRHNHYVDGLKGESFELMENDRPQAITTFEDSSQSVSCALILDTTGSMEKTLPFVRNAASHFIDQLGANDSIAIYTFAEKLERKQDFTDDRSAAKRAILRTRAGGKTALFDALAQTAREISGRPGKKAMVVFSDGDDNNSVLNANAAAGRLRKLGIPLYAIAEGEALESKALLKVLEEMSRQTGGALHRARKVSDMEQVFAQISESIQHTYLLTYKAPHTADSAWKAIKVIVPRSPEYQIRAREGYFPN